MKKIKVAFAGFEHSHMFGVYEDISRSELFEAAGACEENDRVIKEAENRGIVFTHPDYESLICDPSADTVAVGTNYGARGSLIIKALEAGKSIIADKPLCTSPGELEAIEKLAHEKGLAVCILLSLRGDPVILGAVNAIRNGAVGRVNNIIFEGEHPLNYGKRPGWYFEKGKHGGVINDIAVHGIDLVRLMTGSNVKNVIAARKWNFYADKEPGFFDSAQFMLSLESGAGVIADVSYSAPSAHGYSHPSYWHFRVFGSLGMADFGLNAGKAMLYPASGEAREIPPEKPEKDLFEEFYAAVTGETDREKYTSDMLEASKQTLKIEKSAEVIK